MAGQGFYRQGKCTSTPARVSQGQRECKNRALARRVPGGK